MIHLTLYDEHTFFPVDPIELADSYGVIRLFNNTKSPYSQFTISEGGGFHSCILEAPRFPGQHYDLCFCGHYCASAKWRSGFYDDPKDNRKHWCCLCVEWELPFGKCDICKLK